jgi:hypothetical protein
MSSEKYKLKWSKYESNVLNAFRDLFETEALSDVTLFCEGEADLLVNPNQNDFLKATS